jgi:peptidoglycan/xylan/chitin deacetylase (PgdA/CDA1 family)
MISDGNLLMRTAMPTDTMPPILMYHSVTPDRHDRSPWTVHIERFDQQMRWLHQRGFRGTSIRDLLKPQPDEARSRLVGLAFDDGYANFAEYSLPILQRYGFTATAFIVAGRFGAENIWANEPPKALLTAEQVRLVADAGFEVGSHSMRHFSLSSAPDGELTEEIVKSRHILQQISGQDVSGFCYPFGQHDARVVRYVQTAGYEYACACGYSEFTGRFALPRIYVGNDDSSARLWGKAIQYWLRWEYRGPGARILAAISARRAGLTPRARRSTVRA